MNLNELKFWYRVYRTRSKTFAVSFLPACWRPDYCNICQETSLFHDAVFGEYYRPRIICPHCKSWDRHRSAYDFYLKQDWNGGRTYHFDAERCLIPRLSTFINRYSYDDSHRFNIQNLHAFRSDSYQNVLMHAVLEAVDDLPAAMNELYRILKQGGRVFVTCGINANIKTRTRKLSTGSLREFGSIDFIDSLEPFKLEKIVDFEYPTKMVVLRKD